MAELINVGGGAGPPPAVAMAELAPVRVDLASGYDDFQVDPHEEGKSSAAPAETRVAGPGYAELKPKSGNKWSTGPNGRRNERSSNLTWRPNRGFNPNITNVPTTAATAVINMEPLTKRINAINQFSNAMFTHFLAENHHGNVSISPFNIHAVLFIVSFGVRLMAYDEIQKNILKSGPNTDVYNELLKLTGNDDYFKMLSGVFVDSSLEINQTFKKFAVDELKALIEQLDFKRDPGARRRQINDLVCTKTNDKNSELFAEGSIDVNTVMVLASAVHIKCAWAWAWKFTSSTSTFWNFGTTPVKVKMMYMNRPIKYYYDEELSYAAIMLSSEAEKYSMMIILPDHKDGLKRFDLTKINVSQLVSDQKRNDVHLYLPSFKVDQSLDLKEILSTKFGCPSMFKNEAYFNNINKDVWLKEFMHKTYVYVHETGIGDAQYIYNESIQMNFDTRGKTVNFIADHPFAYYLMNTKDEKNFLILSGGIITEIDPVEQ